MAPAVTTNAAAAAPADEASKSLKCKTWVLKVFIHCEGCKRQVKKALHSIDGVYTTTVDSQQHKVTVVGNVDSDTLIKKLSKAGKNAEIWPENSPAKSNNNNNNKQSGEKQQNDTKNADTNNSKNAGEQSGKKGKNDTQGKPPADNKHSNSSADNKKKKGNDSPAAPGEKQQGGGGNAGKKNKNQGGDQKVGSNNNENGAPISSGSFYPNQAGAGAGAGHDLNPPHLLQQQSYSYPFYAPNQAPQPAAPLYVLSYSNAPSPYGKDHRVSYQVPASSICVGTQQPLLLDTIAPLEAVPRFDVFSEENPNGCSIM